MLRQQLFYCNILCDTNSFRRNTDEIFDILPDPYQFDEKTKENAKTELNEDPSTVRENVQRFRDTVKAESDLTSRTDDSFLLAFLRARKYNMEKALKVLKNYYKLRELYPDYFKLCLPHQNKKLFNTNWLRILNDRDAEGRTVLLIQPVANPSDLGTEDCIRLLSYIMNLLITDPKTQVNGVVALINMETMSVGHMKYATPTCLKLIAKLAQDSFPLRIRHIFMVNQNWISTLFFSIFLPLLSGKLRNRIQIVGRDYVKLQPTLGPEILPKYLGGEIDLESTDEHYEQYKKYNTLFTECQKYGYSQ